MQKIKQVENFSIYFEAEPEQTSLRAHLIKDCGWSELRYASEAPIAGKFFCAHIQIRVDDYVLSDQYLGCCHYATAQEFYTKYADDYCADMIREGLEEARVERQALIEKLKSDLLRLTQWNTAPENLK